MSSVVHFEIVFGLLVFVGVLMYQRERKNRLVNAYQQDDDDLHKLQSEEQDILQMIHSQQLTNNNTDTSMVCTSS